MDGNELSILSNALDPNFNGIIFLPLKQIKFYNQKYFKNDKFVIIKDFMIFIPTVFYFPKTHFTAMKAFNEKIYELQSSGLIKYWNDNFMVNQKVFKSIELPQQLTMKHLSILFNILEIGLFIACITFVLEICYIRIEKSRSLTKNKKVTLTKVINNL